MKLTSADLKNIYYNLSTYNVMYDESLFGTQKYIFGSYYVSLLGPEISVGKLNQKYMDLWNANKDSQDNPIYKLSIAVKNKYNGKNFINPYENEPTEKIVQESANTFEKILTKNAVAVFPYDFQKTPEKYTKMIYEMKRFFIQKIHENYK